MSYIGKKNGNPNTDFLEAGGELENHDLINVDASGNVLLGTTNSTPGIGDTDSGISLRGSSGAFISRTTASSGVSPFYVNRNSSDGHLIYLAKDGTEVGNMSTRSSNLSIGSGDVSLEFNPPNDAILPSSTLTNNTRDAAIDLGLDTVRFKDLYLSGGVYVGGTGSANYLDDYEEGTWTPAFVNGTVTYGNRSGVYTKVGGLVQASFMVQWTAISGSYEPRITLPFNATSSTNFRASGAVGYMKGVDFGTSVNSSWITTANQGDVNLVLNYDNATPSFGNINNWSSSGEIQGTIVYRTNS